MVMLLHEPELLREKAREHRHLAQQESDSSRCRAHMRLASEYELLADAIEEEATAGRSEPAA